MRPQIRESLTMSERVNGWAGSTPSRANAREIREENWPSNFDERGGEEALRASGLERSSGLRIEAHALGMNSITATVAAKTPWSR